MQGVLDVFPLTQLAGPTTIGQLPSRMRRNVFGVRKQRDSLETWFEIFALTGYVAE